MPHPMSEAQEPRDFWNDSASDYFRMDGTLKWRVLYPQLLTLAGNVRGQRVLDLGCGQGDLSAQLAARGAVVLGVDSSAVSIRRAATRHAESPNLTFAAIEPPDYSPVLAAAQTAPFDLAVLAVVLGNVPDEPGETALFAALARSVRPGGRLLLADNHPCFRRTEFSSVSQRFRPEQYRQERSPVQISVRDGYRDAPPVTFTNAHRSLAHLSALVAGAGFLIRRIHELYDRDDPALHSGARARVNPHVPAALVIDAVRTPLPPGREID